MLIYFINLHFIIQLPQTKTSCSPSSRNLYKDFPSFLFHYHRLNKASLMQRLSKIMEKITSAMCSPPPFLRTNFMFLELISRQKKNTKKCARKRQTYFFILEASFGTCSCEKHIIYVFVLFSHNFIINVYHHYCSYSIFTLLMLLPDEELFLPLVLVLLCVKTSKNINLGHEKREAKKEGKLPFFEIFAFQKDTI
jgi:hypothetical protein